MSSTDQARFGDSMESIPMLDLASRALGGSVVHANDELFAEKENLIKPEPAVDISEFGHKGGVYDGWETRRRRDGGSDHVIVRLGVPGVLSEVVVDTAFFLGNYPPYVSVDAACVRGYPDPAALDRADWVQVVPKSAAKGGVENTYVVSDKQIYTHVRLTIHPDGGVARLRARGTARPDPRRFHPVLDAAALLNGGDVVAATNTFYSSPRNILQPGSPVNMGSGWETARRRNGGNDAAVVRLAGPTTVREFEVDTAYFVGNAPHEVRVLGTSDITTPIEEWTELLPVTPTRADTRHNFRAAAADPVTHLLLEVRPDGGLARFRVWGELAPGAARWLFGSWLDSLPAGYAREVLVRDHGLDASEADQLLGRRPVVVDGTVCEAAAALPLPEFWATAVPGGGD